MPRKKATDKQALGMQIKSGWEILKDNDRQIDAFCSEYIDFLCKVKTEREAVTYIKNKAAQTKGIRIIENRGKALAVWKQGKLPLDKGIRLIIGHIDSPRLDLKVNPLYEDMDLVMLKTHYYGGIKKYQWLARPLALHGIVIREDGSAVSIVIGEDEGDPCFTIEDLLPHLSGKAQTNKKVSDAFQGEKLNIIFGSRPDLRAKDEKVKKHILSLLYEKYSIKEEDFVSADLEVVPAGPAREIGLDRSLIGAYGHDDRACSWAGFSALAGAEDLPYTSVTLLVDKEEIGSDGNTGAKSRFLEEVLWNISDQLKQDIVPPRVLYRSKAISGDVTSALDPEYPEVHEKNNAAKIGYGVCVTKFTGSRGKYGASEAHAEYMGWIRSILNRKNIPWQTGELGKVDEGGGGTVAKFLAEYGMDIVDMGPALLSMHAPFELASKVDMYATFLAYRAFMEET